MLDPEAVLLTSDVARLFNVSSEAVREWARHGRLPARRTVGGVRLFAGRDVLQLHQDRNAPTQSPEAA